MIYLILAIILSVIIAEIIYRYDPPKKISDICGILDYSTDDLDPLCD